MRVGEDLSTERRFGAAKSGPATIEDLIAVENTDGIDITPDGARGLTTAFAERPATIAERPSLAQGYTFNVRATERVRTRADAPIEQVGALLEGTGGPK